MQASQGLLLRTQRLLLRPVETADLSRLHELFVEPAVRKYLCDDLVLPPDKVAEFISTSQQTFETAKYGLWLMLVEDDVVGVVGLYSFFEERQPQLLYALSSSHWGKGLATEASRRVLEYAFDQLEYDFVDASCDVPNTDSVRLMERLGMVQFKREVVDGKPLVFYRLQANVNGTNAQKA